MIGHDITAALPELRAEAESLMVTECRLERLDGHDTDPDTGYRADRWVLVWAGSCKAVTSREAREITVGGQKVTVKPTTVSIPWDAPRGRVGDRFVTEDGDLHVVGVERHSWPVQQRYACAEHQG